ncbi:InsB [Shigella sonnei]|nr:InsB [Shigella sonnei]
MLGGADNPNGELPSYITGADKNNDFLVRTGLRSGVSELQLPCFTAVRAVSKLAASPKW